MSVQERRTGFSRNRHTDKIARRALVMSVGLWATCLSTVAMIALV